MSNKKSGAPSKTKPQISRRIRVIKMLEVQLGKNTKVTKDGNIVPLTEKDITRINKELVNLKKKI